MRTLKPFEYFEPQTLKEALNILSVYGNDGKVLAGGTDLIVSMKKRQISPKYLISINNIPKLSYIEYSLDDGLRIGALATHRSIFGSSIVRDHFNLLAIACGKVGNPHIRNMGTIGGNICKAGPSQDTIPSLLVLDAKLKVNSLKDERVVPINEFFVGPFETVLDTTELLTEIRIPTPAPASEGCYKWVTKVTAVDETLVGVAVVMIMDPETRICSDVRIGLGSVGPIPFRAKNAEQLLRGKMIEGGLVRKAAETAVEETSPRSRADYRRKMTRLLVERAVNETWQSITDKLFS